MSKKVSLIILFLFAFSTIAFSLPYIDPSDTRALDNQRFIDTTDPRLNILEPQKYLDTQDTRPYEALNKINSVKSLQGNIDLYSSDSTVIITPDYLNSRLNLQSTSGSFSGDINWTQLTNYPVGCGPGQAVQVINDTLTCISVTSSNNINWSELNFVIPWQDANIANAIRYKQDASCDNNAACRLLSSTIAWDSNAVLDGRYAFGSDLNNYLPLTGGQLGGPLSIKVSPQNGALVIHDDIGNTYAVFSTDGTETQLFTPFRIQDLSSNTYFFVPVDGNPIESGASIIPTVDNTYNLGDPSFRWRNSYFASIFADDITTSGISATNLTVSNQATINKLSVSDLNASLSDLNQTQSCSAGQALQSVGNTTSCTPVSVGTGRTYTSGTPATIQVNNDLNTISQNFDGNFASRFDGNFNRMSANLFPVQDINVAQASLYKATCDNNSACVLLSSAFRWDNNSILENFLKLKMPIQDANIASSAVWNSKISWTQLNTIVPWKDVNIFSASRWDADVNWGEIGPLFPVPDSNIANSIRYNQDSTCDNNAACKLLSSTFLWDSNTITDSRYVRLNDLNNQTVSKIIAGNNITISPTNGIGDVNISATASGCPSNSDCDFNHLSATQFTLHGVDENLLIVKDNNENVAFQINTAHPSTEHIRAITILPSDEGGPHNLGQSGFVWGDLWVDRIFSSTSIDTISFTSISSIITHGKFTDLNVTTKIFANKVNTFDLNVSNNADLNGPLTQIKKANINDLNATTGHFDQNVSFDNNIIVSGTITLDGNLFAKDANTYIGRPGLSNSTGDKNIIFTGYNYTCNALGNDTCMFMSVNTLAWNAANSVGGGFNLTNRAFNIFGNLTSTKDIVHSQYASGAANGAYYDAPIAASSISATGGNVESMGYMRDFQSVHDANQPWQFRNGIWESLFARETIGTPKDGITDQNIDSDTNQSGNYNLDGNFTPDKNGMYSLGSSTKKWADTWGGNIHAGDLTFSNGLVIKEPDQNTICIYSSNNTLLNCYGDTNTTNYVPVIQKQPVGNQPTCTAANEGMTWLTKGVLGVATKYEMCRQTALNVYVWSPLLV